MKQHAERAQAVSNTATGVYVRANNQHVEELADQVALLADIVADLATDIDDLIVHRNTAPAPFTGWRRGMWRLRPDGYWQLLVSYWPGGDRWWAVDFDSDGDPDGELVDIKIAPDERPAPAPGWWTR